MRKTLLLILLLLNPTNILLAEEEHDHGHNHSTHSEESNKGPHGGVLLKDADLAVEVKIFEDNSEPQFRVYAYQEQELLDPKNYTVSIITERFMRGQEVFKLTPQENYQTLDKIVSEPHSFALKVQLIYKDKEHWFNHESLEGRTTLSAEALQIADLRIEAAESQKIYSTAEVFGRILPNEDKVAHIYPRFAGIVKEIHKKLGDTVEKDEVLAVIESNQSLQNYEIRAYSSGVVVKRHATIGEFIRDDREIYVIADLSEVWADFQVYRDDFSSIMTGQEIFINIGKDQKPIQAKVSYISPLTDLATQSKLVRAVISNQDNSLRPGLFVSGILSGTATQSNIAVKREALQTFRNWNVVYITDGHIFQAIPIEIGKQDQNFAEILSGLKVGDRYVTKNSFIIKADIEKSGASHDH